jgi:hypothetical protein
MSRSVREARLKSHDPASDAPDPERRGAPVHAIGDLRMRIGAIGSDAARTTEMQAAAARPATPTRPAATQAPKAPAPAAKDADGDFDGDMGTKGGLIDFGA